MEPIASGAVLGSPIGTPVPWPLRPRPGNGEDVLMPFDAGSQARLHIHHEEGGNALQPGFQFEGFFRSAIASPSVHRAGGLVPR